MRTLTAILTDLRQGLSHATRERLESGARALEVVLAAAFAKSLEFATFVHSDAGGVAPFFATPSLRGICEDIIGLAFVKTLPPDDRQTLIVSLAIAQLDKSVEAQSTFFDAARKTQPLVRSSPEMRKQSKKAIALLKKKHWPNARYDLPSAFQMAARADLGELYQYFYHGTSEWVHFTPRILMRMGWSQERSHNAEYEFSTENLRPYYTEFNRFYSAYLLVAFVETFAREVSIPSDDSRIAELRTYLDQTPRWPELVTFEELNLKRPK